MQILFTTTTISFSFLSLDSFACLFSSLVSFVFFVCVCMFVIFVLETKNIYSDTHSNIWAGSYKNIFTWPISRRTNFLLFTRYSLLFIHYSLLFIHYSLLFTRYSLLLTRYSFLFTRYSLIFTLYSLQWNAVKLIEKTYIYSNIERL